jgi:hypothetical protein
MKKLILLTLFALGAATVHAQTFEVPQNVKFEKAADYARYEKEVIQAVNWLASNAPDNESAKRKEVSAFLLMYLTGTPDVSIEINAEIITFMESSPDMLMLFMGGWAKHTLENNDKDIVNGNLAGLKAVTSYYTNFSSELKKDKNIEKFVKMESKGKLKDFVEKKVG